MLTTELETIKHLQCRISFADFIVIFKQFERGIILIKNKKNKKFWIFMSDQKHNTLNHCTHLPFSGIWHRSNKYNSIHSKLSLTYVNCTLTNLLGAS